MNENSTIPSPSQTLGIGSAQDQTHLKRIMLFITLSSQEVYNLISFLPDLVLFCMIIGSTFGGNPLASAVAVAALDVIRDEGLTERYCLCLLKILYSL